MQSNVKFHKCREIIYCDVDIITVRIVNGLQCRPSMAELHWHLHLEFLVYLTKAIFSKYLGKYIVGNVT